MVLKRVVIDGAKVDSRTAKERIQILLQEYRSLYDLVETRMDLVQRRIPVTGVTLTGLLASVLILPPTIRAFLLIAIPIALIWMTRLTIAHAKSFEDLFRRIELIERRVNNYSGAELLSFQSRHPSRSYAVGGRIGTESVHSVVVFSLMVLAAGLVLVVDSTTFPLTVYTLYSLIIAVILILHVTAFRRYKYQPGG